MKMYREQEDERMLPGHGVLVFFCSARIVQVRRRWLSRQQRPAS